MREKLNNQPGEPRGVLPSLIFTDPDTRQDIKVYGDECGNTVAHFRVVAGLSREEADARLFGVAHRGYFEAVETGNLPIVKDLFPQVCAAVGCSEAQFLFKLKQSLSFSSMSRHDQGRTLLQLLDGLRDKDEA